MAGAKTLQSGTAIISSGNTSTTASISTIDTSKSFVVFSSKGDPDGQHAGGRLSICGYFNSATQLIFERQVIGGSTDITIKWYVVSFSSGVTIQHGSTSDVRNNTADITISSVTTSQSFVIVSNKGENSWDYGGCQLIRGNVQSSTTLRLRARGTAYNNNTCRWQVIDYTGASVQLLTGVHSGGVTSGTLPVSSINMSNSFIIGNAGHNTDNLGNALYEVIWKLSSAIAVSWERANAYQDRSYVYQVVSIPSEISVQRGNEILTGTSTSFSDALTSVDTAKVFPLLNGPNGHLAQLVGSAAGYFLDGAFNFEINISSSTSLAGSRSYGATNYDAKFYWEVIEFVPQAIPVSPNSISSAEVFGSPSIGLQVRPSSIISSEVFGTPGVGLGISIMGIASTEAFGSPTILPGSVNVAPGGIVSAEALGSPTINLSISISSIDSGEAMGIPTLMYDQEITLGGITSEEAFGLIKIDMSIKFAGAIASAEAWGSPFLTVGIVYIDTIGIQSEETFGLPSVVPGSVFIVSGSIPSGEAFGSLSLGIGIVPSSIASGEAFGSLTILNGVVLISPDSILSSEGFGTPTFLPENVNISVLGIASGQSFGSPTILRGTVYIQAQSIATSESWGSPSIVPMTAYVNPNGIASAEVFGAPSLNVGYVDISPYGITSIEGFGSPYVTAMGAQVSPFSINSDEVLGEPSVIPGGVVITLQGISSGELFGAPTLSPGIVYITPDGIASLETFGSVNVVQSIRVDTIISEEGFGSPTITTGNVNISPNGIVSQEAFGSHIVRNVLVIYLDASGIGSLESFGLPTIINIVRNAFQTLMESDLEQGFFNLGEFAEIAVYIHKDGTTVQLPVIFDQDTVMVDPNTGAEILSRQPMIQVQTSDFFVTPDKGDKVVVRGVRYQVITYEPDGTGVASLRLHHERTV